LPIIARDLPVFREVAGEHVFYFAGMSPDALAEKLEEWLIYYKSGTHPRSAEIECLTWRESANQLQQRLVVDDEYSTVWRPRHTVNFAASHFVNADLSTV
jgi:hypothetical protein